MKAVIALIFLVTLLIKITVFAQSETPENSEKSTLNDLTVLGQSVDLYYEQLISVKSQLGLEGAKITSPNLKKEDAEKVKALEESRKAILGAFNGYRAQIEGLSNNPEALETLESAKLLYNIALMKAFMPRFEKAKTSLVTKLFSTLEPQFAEELLTRAEALKLVFTDFQSNEPSKDALNLNYRITEVVKAYNAVSIKMNQQRESNLYQVYPPNLKIATAAEEAALYESIIRGTEYQGPGATQASTEAPKPPTLKTTQEGPNEFVISLTCSGFFGI